VPTTTTTTTTEQRVLWLLLARLEAQRAAHAGRTNLSRNVRGMLARKRAALILDEQRSERDSIRAARRAQADAMSNASLTQLAAGARPNLDMLKAQHRDRARAALSYSMKPAEVLAAVRDAVSAARLPDDDSRAETISEVVKQVIARHGPQPLRVNVGRDWLVTRCKRTYLREAIKRERATGLQASARLLAQWRDDDSSEDALERLDSGPDAVYRRAAGMDAPAADTDALSSAEVAARIGDRLQLTARQRAAVALTLESRKRVTLALSGADRKAATQARNVIRKRFPDAWSLRLALRPDRERERILAALAVDGTIGEQRERAALAARGSLLTGRCDSASALPSRLTRTAQPQPQRPAPAVLVTPPFPGYGSGYGGASSVLYLYRPGGTHRDERPAPALRLRLPQRPAQRIPVRVLTAAQQLQRKRLHAVLAATVRLPGVAADRPDETQGADPWDTRSAPGHDPNEATNRGPLVTIGR
jgi:hypothetical protein